MKIFFVELFHFFAYFNTQKLCQGFDFGKNPARLASKGNFLGVRGDGNQNKPNFMKLKNHMYPKPILIYLPYFCQICILTTNPKPRESSALQNKLRWKILIEWTFIN